MSEIYQKAGAGNRHLDGKIAELNLERLRNSEANRLMMERQAGEDFSVVVLASDLGVDARSLLCPAERRARVAEEAAAEAAPEEWHDCSEEDFSDFTALQVLRFEGLDKSGNRILRIVGKYFPATVITGERLKRYVFHKLTAELPDGPFCILYMHTTVQKEDNNPGMSILRWIYEELPVDYKERLQVVYFLHPGLRSRLAIATLGRLFLSGDIYRKIKYVSRLQYLWEDIKKGQVEIPEFVQRHDEVLEHRPLTDYGIEPDPLHLTGVPAMECSFGRYEDKWPSREYM